jgi:hypothetical protein
MVCAPALAGCGGGSSESKPDGPQLVARVASTTAAAKTATVFVSLVASGSPDGSGRVDGFGAVDLVGGRADLTFDLSGLAPDAPRHLAVRAIGATAYVDFAGQPLPGGATLPTGKHWIRIDATAAPGPQSVSPLGDLNTHPTRVLQALRSVARSVRAIGTEKVRGVTTTRFRSDVTLVDILRPSTPGGAGQQQPAVRDALAKLGGARVPVDVWIGSDGRARRLEVTLTAAAFAPIDPSAALDHTIVTTSVEFSDFGRPVHVVTPPVAETAAVADVPHLGEALGVTSGPSVTPAGPWTTVQSGSTSGIDWVLLQAPATDPGSVCTGLDVGTRAPSGQPGDYDCLGRNTASDPITVYGSSVTGSKTYVFGTALPEADHLTVTSQTGAAFDATLRGGTFVAFLADAVQITRIDAFAGSRRIGSCTNPDTTSSTAPSVDNSC